MAVGQRVKGIYEELPLEIPIESILESPQMLKALSITAKKGLTNKTKDKIYKNTVGELDTILAENFLDDAAQVAFKKGKLLEYWKAGNGTDALIGRGMKNPPTTNAEALRVMLRGKKMDLQMASEIKIHMDDLVNYASTDGTKSLLRANNASRAVADAFRHGIRSTIETDFMTSASGIPKQAGKEMLDAIDTFHYLFPIAKGLDVSAAGTPLIPKVRDVMAGAINSRLRATAIVAEKLQQLPQAQGLLSQITEGAKNKVENLSPNLGGKLGLAKDAFNLVQPPLSKISADWMGGRVMDNFGQFDPAGFPVEKPPFDPSMMGEPPITPDPMGAQALQFMQQGAPGVMGQPDPDPMALQQAAQAGGFLPPPPEALGPPPIALPGDEPPMAPPVDLKAAAQDALGPKPPAKPIARSTEAVMKDPQAFLETLSSQGVSDDALKAAMDALETGNEEAIMAVMPMVAKEAPQLFENGGGFSSMWDGRISDPEERKIYTDFVKRKHRDGEISLGWQALQISRMNTDGFLMEMPAKTKPKASKTKSKGKVSTVFGERNSSAF